MELDQLIMAMRLHISTTALLAGSSLPSSPNKSLLLWQVQGCAFGKALLAAITVSLQPFASVAKDEGSCKY